MEVEAMCPYCAEPIPISVDEGGGTSQSYIEDCWVCCRPFAVTVTTQDGEPTVDLRRLDE
jgi:hypothetical protein